MNNKKEKKAAFVGSTVKDGYEASVAFRALNRAGHCPQLKGHVHEIMYCDKFNANLANIVDGKHMDLTKSTVAKMKDVIVKDASGKVVGHAQLKDTVSSSGVKKTVDQILNGHYNKTCVIGTEETTAEVGKQLARKGAQEIHSSGISSETTQRIANRALGKMPTASSICGAARSGGTFGAACGAGIEALSSIGDVLDGNKDWDEAAVDVAGAAAKGGIIGAASSAASAVSAGAVGSAISAATGTAVGAAVAGTAVGAAAIAAAPVVVPFAAACAIGSLISDLFDW